MSECKVLKEISNAIASGVPPEEAIPYSIVCSDQESYLEILYYAIQVLPDGRRKDEIKAKLQEVLQDVSRTDSQL